MADGDAVAAGDAGDAARLRVFFIPFFATGHIIPMFELARLMSTARPGVEATMVLTPANADLIRPTLARTAVRLLLYPFPSAEAGLPDGLENLASVPLSDAHKVDNAFVHVLPTHERIIRHHRPDAVIADFHYGSLVYTAKELGIPFITFCAAGAFPVLALSAMLAHRSGITDEPFTVPCLPGPPIEMVRAELPEFLRSPSRPQGDESMAEAAAAQKDRYGAVVNSFYEMEPDYCDAMRGMGEGKAWFVGPVSLSNTGTADAGALFERGGGGGATHECMGWLDAQERASVVFVCFGSWCHFSADQIRGMGEGLEASGKPFLWVVRDSEGEAWETRGRGAILRGWAPQVAILSHPAVGAFMTHCGWNSLLEAASAGVPMLTWPLVFEQFINERLVVTVMRTGVRVWDGFRTTDEEKKVVVPGEAIGKVVSRFMEGGGKGEQARKRAKEYAVMARAAMGDGGSSCRDLNNLIDDLMEAAAKVVDTANNNGKQKWQNCGK